MPIKGTYSRSHDSDRPYQAGLETEVLFSLLFAYSPFPGQPYATPAAPEVLPADQVFQVEGRAAGPHHLEVLFRIADGTYLYRHKLKFEIQPPEIQLGDFQLPAGQPKEDPVFGRIEIYRQSLQVRIPISPPSPETRDITLTVQYQGCSDRGFCYPPKRKKINLTLPPSPPATALKTPPGPEPIDPLSHKYDRLFREGNVLFVLLSFFGFGLLLSLTPCVFPMIPILSGIIVAQGTSVPKGRSFTLSLIYVLGMALTFAAVGVIAGLTGFLISALLQNPWVIGFFSLIFVLLALSMFGFYEIQIPGAAPEPVDPNQQPFFRRKLFRRLFHGHPFGPDHRPLRHPSFGRGPAVYRPDPKLLVGGDGPFCPGLGHGGPAAGHRRFGRFNPLQGRDLDGAIKTFFGVYAPGPGPLPGESLHLPFPADVPLGRPADHLFHLPSGLGPPARRGSGLGPIPEGSGVAHFFDRPGVADRGLRRWEKSLSTPGGASGRGAPVTPLKGTTTTSGLNFQRLTSPAELEQQLQSARGKKVLLYFGAEWCTACKAMERGAFRDPRVQERLKEVKILKFDLTDMTEEAQALLKKFGLFGSPAILFFDEQGQEIKTARLIGEQEPASLLEHLIKCWGDFRGGRGVYPSADLRK